MVNGARGWLRLEGAAVTILSIILYSRAGSGWPLFLLLFLTPDLSFLGYLGGSRFGAVCYNVVHSYILPLGLAGVGAVSGWGSVAPLALIWTAHIGFDRALGYGLKLPSGFHDTHLGRIGRVPPV